MVEISNIDSIIELIFKEARIVKGDQLTARSFMVLSMVSNRLSEVLDTFKEEERREKKHENKARDFRGHA